jgi:hypothetical protein
LLSVSHASDHILGSVPSHPTLEDSADRVYSDACAKMGRCLFQSDASSDSEAITLTLDCLCSQRCISCFLTIRWVFLGNQVVLFKRNPFSE